MRKAALGTAMILAGVLSGGAAQAVTLVFPLEDLALGFGYPGSLSVAKDGLTITIAPDTGGAGGIVNVYSTDGPGQAALQGNREVTAWQDNWGYSPIGIRFSFSLPVIGVDFGYYDQGGDDDGNVVIRAYDAANTLLSEFIDPYGVRFGKSSGTLSFTSGASYFTLETTGTANQNSLGWSIRSVTAVPELSTYALMLLGVGGISVVTYARRRVR